MPQFEGGDNLYKGPTVIPPSLNDIYRGKEEEEEVWNILKLEKMDNVSESDQIQIAPKNKNKVIPGSGSKDLLVREAPCTGITELNHFSD